MLRDITTPILIGTAVEGSEIDEAIGEFSKQTEESSRDAEIYNQVLSISPGGKIAGSYAKMHLVPFW